MVDLQKKTDFQPTHETVTPIRERACNAVITVLGAQAISEVVNVAAFGHHVGEVPLLNTAGAITGAILAQSVLGAVERIKQR